MASDKVTSKSNTEVCNVLVANVVYLLMNKSYHISRNVRAQWFLRHLNSTITLPPSSTQLEWEEDCELLVLSVVPSDPPDDWSVENRHKYRYLITTSCNLVFFNQVYSTVYCLDMSPSISAVDTQHGEVMLDEVVKFLSESLKAVVNPVKIPGSSIVFEPQIFVTVIVHTPFFTTPAQQVLVQGWQVTQDNVGEFLAAINKQLQLLEDTIAEVSALAYDQLEAVRIRQMESDKLVGALFEESPEKQVPLSAAEIPMVSPDSGFINLLRYGMLALRLLPHSSLSNLVVVTDGVLALPDINVLDLVLSQLRTNAVAVSFLHIGSQFHPQCAQGLVPYSELMQFISCATFGTYIPLPALRNYDRGGLNTYHEALLTWSFKRGTNIHELSTPLPRNGEWYVSNHSFYGNREPQLLMKKQLEDDLNASLSSVLCCRLHEGFMIKNISFKDCQIELNLLLPWSNHIYIEYTLSSEWPIPPHNGVHFAISFKAPYEFLHDITCMMKKQFHSPYRQAVVSRFWVTLKTLAHSDLLLAHLDSFSTNPQAFSVPESVRSGMPLFYLPTESGPPTPSSSDRNFLQFPEFWLPVSMLDPSVWHKWMHTHSVSLLLQHDMPLPKYLHTASPNGRYQGLVCRQAAATLLTFLKDHTTFVLIENHAFLKFIYKTESDKVPTWFYIVRVDQKSPCTVIHIAFLGGTPGKLRHQIVEQLKEKMVGLITTQRASIKESSNRNIIEPEMLSLERSNVLCCIVLNKPLEKILIRYEKMPSEFETVVFPDGTQPQTASKPFRPNHTGTLVTTLSRYLHHRRWIWKASTQNHNLTMPSVSRILSVLTQMRLQEGFRFAHSTAGIINMVLEIQMKCCDQESDHNCENCRPCIIQYVLFPLHIVTQPNKESTSDEDEGEEDEVVEGVEGENCSMELIAEVWIEPQHGIVAKGPPQRAYMENLPYHLLADVMWKMDAECISSVLTFEQLRVMCQNPQAPTPPRVDPLEAQPRNPLENWPHATALSDQRIQQIPFAYNVVSVLPESQQIELQLSMFIQDLGEDWRAKNPGDAPNVLLMENFIQQLKTLHDKELGLSPIESKQLVESIFKRKRNNQQHPVPFPRRQSQDVNSKTSVKRNLIKNLKDADKENEWPRIKREDLMGSNPDNLNRSNPSLQQTPVHKMSTPDSTSTSGVRKSCGPLYRMYTKGPPHLPRRDTDVERDTPKWRFFVKNVSPTFIILTFVPWSYKDCKSLMLGAEPKAWNLLSAENSPDIVHSDNVEFSEQSESEKLLVEESTLNPEAKPFQPVSKNVDNCPSPLSTSRGWVLENLDSLSNVFDPSQSITDLDNQSSWDLNKGNLDPTSPFRLRARSWEPMKPQSVVKTKKYVSPRTRTHSVGSKSKNWSDQKLKRKLMYEDSNSLLSLNTTRTSKQVKGSINIPIYVYRCCVDNLIDAVVLKSGYTKDFKDLYWAKSMYGSDEEGFEADIHFEEPVCVEETSDDVTLIQEYDIQEHGKTIVQVFNKSFGKSLFKSLHLGHRISSGNVQTAMEGCELSLIEINITEYMQTVCQHLKDIKDKLPSNEEEAGVEESQTPLAAFNSPSPCVEYRNLHKLIKNKFYNIITTTFKPVPSNPDFYFCSPHWERDPPVSMNTTVEVSHGCEFDPHVSTDCVEFRSDRGSTLGAVSPWEAVGSVTPEELHTSLLSNMDSDSVSIFAEEETEELLPPLFLQLICTIQSNRQLGHCPVRVLPTCLGELVDYLNYPESSVNVNTMTVSLDLICLTMPQIFKPTTTVIEPSPNTTSSSQQTTLPLSTTYEGLRNLPDQQHKAISWCIDETNWLMKDEIAAFLLDASPVTEQTLQLVANHVNSSCGRSSCILQIVPLQFVFGADQSFQTFLTEIEDMRVAGYCLKKEAQYLYLVKDSRESQESRTSLALSQDLNNISLIPFNATGEDSKLAQGSPSVRPDFKVEAEPRPGGWSSIAAWHAQVAQQMEEGLFQIEGLEGGDGELDEQTDWLNDLELRRAELPNFWLILFPEPNGVTVYFHCRFLELETTEVKLYSLVQKNVVSSIRNVCKTVNQKLLLNKLHDSRMCNSLLEPESVENLWPAPPVGGQPTTPEMMGNDAETPVESISVDLELGFAAGYFSCPVVWETNLTLHPRLKTGPIKPGASRGIQALRSVLNRFSVNNRKNMFVYKDQSANVFYLRLYERMKTVNKVTDGDESSPMSVSRSSSINSLNMTGAKRIEDIHTPLSNSALMKELRPRLKSVGETGEIVRQEEYLTLVVHGISEAGAEVKSELVQVLNNRLDDAVLEVLSVMLARNPMCKLSPEDVHFIQRPNHLPDSTLQFSIPKEAVDNLQYVAYYLRQNLIQFLHNPKYTDTRAQFHFQDYSHPEDTTKQVNESNIFLCNQSPSSGNKGIACIALAFVDPAGNLCNEQLYSKPLSTSYNEPITAAQFNSLTTSNQLQPGECNQEDAVLVEFRVWKQGRVNLESLTLKLKSAIRHSLWDFILELKLLTSPLYSEGPRPPYSSAGEVEQAREACMNPVYQNIIPPFMQFGHKLAAPSVSTNVVTLSLRHSVNTTLKEMAKLVSTDGNSCFIFYQKDTVYVPYTPVLIQTLPSSTTCLLIARNMEQWHASLKDNLKPNIDKLEPKAHKVLQKFSPLLKTATSDSRVQFVPRQRFLIAIINNEKIILHTYNWAKELIEVLMKQIVLLGQWLSARSNLLVGVIHQKMGLFFNQPITRKHDGQATNTFMSQGSDVESLLVFPGMSRTPRSPALSGHMLQDVLRDTKPVSRRVHHSDIICNSVHQLLDTRSQDKRGDLKKLYTMWQTRGATLNIPLAEDMLQVFLHYSRIIHYCVTPLLFLPRWRIQSASTRDFSLKTHNIQSQTSPQDVSNMEEKWHQNLCNNFLNEYKQYLQSLGFIPIQIVPCSPKKGQRTTKPPGGSPGKELKSSCFLQKSLLGGILVVELCLNEPFFCVRLHALECTRLEGKSSSNLISQFTLGFLDECDKMKVVMHLHSFTYDYHLRTLTRYLHDPESTLRPGYHITTFLDDFLKYYSKAPNYAYSLVHSDSLVIPKMSTSAHMIFTYLLNHQENYPMKVVRQAATIQDLDDKVPSASREYVLVQQSGSSQLMYRDSQDVKQVYEYDTVLVVTHEETPDPTVLRLRYFILLTSRREPYAKLGNERKLGKFCTVSTANPLPMYTVSRETTPPIQEETLEELEINQNSPKNLQERRHSSHHVEIKPECVNYLGYYSSHEQFMQQLIQDQSRTCKRTVEQVISEVALHCRTHHLWTKLTTATSSGTSPTYAEFCELLSLGNVEALADTDPRISPILAQPISWYQSLTKLLMTKYADHYRSFLSTDNSKQYLLILHQRIPDGFIMVAIDTITSRGELSVVTSKGLNNEKVTNAYLPGLIEDVVNACCFHLWAGLLQG